MERIKKWWQERKRKKAIQSIRREMGFWGLNMNHLTDEEVEIRFRNMSFALADTGLSIEELGRAAEEMSRAMKKFTEEFVDEWKEREGL